MLLSRDSFFRLCYFYVICVFCSLVVFVRVVQIRLSGIGRNKWELALLRTNSFTVQMILYILIQSVLWHVNNTPARASATVTASQCPCSILL